MKQLFINIVGHNASGKTTLAKRLEEDFGFNRVSGDTFREFIHDSVSYFKDTDMSYPNERYNLLSPLVVHYRQELSWILLRAGQSVLFDGSGSKRVYREVYFQNLRLEFPEVIRIILWVDIEEHKLIERLQKRGKNWVRQFQDLKKRGFEPPEADEADAIIHYTQTNYDEIKQQLSKLLN